MADQRASVELLGNDALEQSAVVANCAMNRERQLSGVNSYTRELGFNPLDVLAAGLVGAGRAELRQPPAGWICAAAPVGR
ncbi:hypothetical protein OG559_02090 [Micromonospora sp. NBC_01405]|uniref:hypothetical protein n=1 Tax=Micromonospora sp. NBC_01405 TaxID=2903589 RepID=UPI0032494CF4